MSATLVSPLAPPISSHVATRLVFHAELLQDHDLCPKDQDQFFDLDLLLILVHILEPDLILI